MPSNSGAVGGKRTGPKMSHYVIPDGPFARVFAELKASGWKLNLQSAPARVPDRKKSESKTKFSCPECELNAWAKAGAEIT
jgi:hypothetical protein